VRACVRVKGDTVVREARFDEIINICVTIAGLPVL
jgi:hypothetical protein